MEIASALGQERLLLAERLLSEIERRHGLPPSGLRSLDPAITDRFLVAYLPQTCDGEPVPQAVELAFTPSLREGLELLGRVVDESREGYGAACYIHDLDPGVSADTSFYH